jgi:hypothetical protein
LLVGPTIDVEFGREDHDSIPVTAIGKRSKSLDVRVEPQI